MEDTLTGSYIALASLIVLGLSYFGIVIPKETIVTVILGIVALYGIIHQLTVSRIATGSFK